MIYVALLRGINVGGNNRIDMKTLKQSFEKLGLSDVKTYINSGNIIFGDDKHSPAELVKLIEAAIAQDFGLAIKVVLRSIKEIQATTAALPDSWLNNNEMKCDVMFLWSEVDNKKVLGQLTIKPGIDDVKYVPGAIVWRVDRGNVTGSGLMKLAGSELYKKMTIRNCNTLRKLKTLMEEI